MRKGNLYYPTDESKVDLHKKLPFGSYTIKRDKNDPNEILYFEEIDPFTIDIKIYGDATKNADRIMKTFLDRPGSTGVLLTGEKGSGKTLLAKTLSIACKDLGYPTIVINTPLVGEDFNTLIQSIDQPAMILFDEFEKVYDRDEQKAILTLLDGVYPTNKLFVLTCNDSWRIDEHLRNRPGRIFYLLEFRGLDVDFITEYCEENLNDTLEIESICRMSTLFSEFNFDMLKALCEEMNRFNETAREAVKLINARPQTDTSGKYKVTLNVLGEDIKEKSFAPTEWTGNPLSKDQFTIEHYLDDGEEEKYMEIIRKTNGMNNGRLVDVSDEGSIEHIFTYAHLKNIDPVLGSFTYVNDSGAKVTFTRIRSIFNYEF